MWILFIAGSWQHAIHPWNPHVVYPLFLALTAILTLRGAKERNVYLALRLVAAGLVSGIMLNSHISYSLGVTVATVLYIAWVAYEESPTKLTRLGKIGRMALACSLYAGAVLVTFIPFFLFEIRHDFLQINTLLTTLREALLRNASVVSVTGMKKTEIARQFFVVMPEQVLQIKNSLVTYAVYAAVTLLLIVRRPAALTVSQRNILRFALLCFITLAVIYLKSSNPVWGYHFIGTEWLYILLIGVLAASHRIIRRAIMLWSIILLLQFIPKMYSTITSDHSLLSTLGTKQTTVERIFARSGGVPFGYAVYSTSLLSYDYDYLFRWLGTDVYQNPVKPIGDADTVYLLIPETDPAIAQDFMHAKTPVDRFETAETWKTPDKMTVIRRVVKK